ncbi:MAG: hypothetical protein ABJC74_07485 [Gemmatimonadota bacterium]
MSSVVATRMDADRTNAAFVFQASVKLGVIESVIVLLFALVSRMLDGVPELALEAVLLLIGLTAVTALPGFWTRARTIEGIAGAAGIGLGATVVFTLIDAILFQHVHLYSHRWLDVGGGSNWWYLPVWWMVGTLVPWLGAWILANQADKSGTPSVPTLMITSLVLAIVVAAVAVVAGFPGAAWGIGTFGVAFLPGLALATLISVLGARRT